MEECEELKEELADLRTQMQEMRLQMQSINEDKRHAEAEAQKLRMAEMHAKAKSAGPVDRKSLTGPGDDVKIIRQGYLMKASGGKKAQASMCRKQTQEAQETQRLPAQA